MRRIKPELMEVNGTQLQVKAPARARPGTRSCSRSWIVSANGLTLTIYGFGGLFKIYPGTVYILVAGNDPVGEATKLSEAFEYCAELAQHFSEKKITGIKNTLITCMGSHGVLYLTQDPITNNATDWEWSEDKARATRYSTNQAIHLQRYYSQRYPKTNSSIVYQDAAAS